MKIGEYRATHGNPHGSDYEFQPDPEGNNVHRQGLNIINGLVRQRILEAFEAKEVNPRSIATADKVDLAHDTNMWRLDKGRFDTNATPTEPKAEKKKKGKNRRHHL